MKTSNIAMYALRMTFGQTSHMSSQSANSTFVAASQSDRLVTRSAAVLAVFGIALSSFSLKQMLSSSNKPASIPLGKF